MAKEENNSYRYENGRRYHAFDEGAYYMPNDESEISRLDTQHQNWLLSLDSTLLRAPIPANPQLVLDVGTGSGIWALDFATQYPTSRVLGIDLSPVVPNPDRPIPVNCTLAVHNAETDWNSFAKPASFDLIHSRMLVQGMHDWRVYFQRCFHYLKPGGWVEVQEVRYPMHSADPAVEADAETPFLRWGMLVKEGLEKGGIQAGAAESFSGWLSEVGFVDVREEVIKWGLGPWMEDEKRKSIGVLERENLNRGLEGITMGAVTRNLGWTREQVKEFVEEVKRDIDDEGRKYYVTV